MEEVVNDTLNHYHYIGTVVKKNLRLLTESNSGDLDIKSLVAFNNHLIISESKLFLEAVKSDLGGEIIEDSKIGTFLYYGNEE